MSARGASACPRTCVVELPLHTDYLCVCVCMCVCAGDLTAVFVHVRRDSLRQRQVQLHRWIVLYHPPFRCRRAHVRTCAVAGMPKERWGRRFAVSTHGECF